MAKAEYRNAGRAGRKLYPRVIFEQAIEQVASGKSLAQVCENPAMPCLGTFYNAFAEDAFLQAAYVAAMRKQVERRVGTIAKGAVSA